MAAEIHSGVSPALVITAILTAATRGGLGLYRSGRSGPSSGFNSSRLLEQERSCLDGATKSHFDPLADITEGNRKPTPWACSHSNVDLPAELDHAVGRNTEELRRRQRIAVHEFEHSAPEKGESSGGECVRNEHA